MRLTDPQSLYTSPNHQVHYKGFVTRRGTLETLGTESPQKKFERVKIAG
jgi:hypothetical protein